MRAIKSNMKDQVLTDDSKILHCPVCDAEYSGNASDYYNYPNNHIFTCSICESEMELVNKIITVCYI